MPSVIRGSDDMDSAGVEEGKAKAWVNFNGTGVVAIRDSFNVSSIIDLGVGDYTVNFIDAMPDANYPFVADMRSGSNDFSQARGDITQSTVSFNYKTAVWTGNNTTNTASADFAHCSMLFF